MPPSDVSNKILQIATVLHSRLSSLTERARLLDAGLARDIEDCKLDLANQITAVVLELQIEAAHERQLEHGT